MEKADYILMLKIVNSEKFSNEEVGKLAYYILEDPELQKIMKNTPLDFRDRSQ